MFSGKVIVLTGPSGVGKSVLANRLIHILPLKRCTTVTTRTPRRGEKHGVDYFFQSVDAFESGIKNGDFVEHSQHYGAYYGVRRSDIEALASKSHVLLLLNWEGALSLQKELNDVFPIYIRPPNKDALLERLQSRGGDVSRIEYAEEDLAHANRFQRSLVNDDLGKCLEDLVVMVRKVCSL